ncbi:MAG: hypothetical protein IJ733_00685 [Lachnospiraceae bacterium]|nr:hypothetical protein [Lachnospiraceae bacterium]
MRDSIIAFPKGNKAKDRNRISDKSGKEKSGIAESGEDGIGRGGLEGIMTEKCAY